MNIGDYVRIVRNRDNSSPIGIKKIETIRDCVNSLFVEINGYTYRACQIVKYNSDLLKVLEEGDLVETDLYGVVEIFKDEDHDYKLCYAVAEYEPAIDILYEEQIKAILTKEQFEKEKFLKEE